MAAASRRGFLRDLVGLPFIGGGLTIIGAPTAVAEPVSYEMLSKYETWLNIEAHSAARELRGHLPMPLGTHTQLYGPAWEWHKQNEQPASTRAALVLSAVGCDWRRRTL